MLEKAIKKINEEITVNGSYVDFWHIHAVKTGYEYGYKQGLRDAKKKAKTLAV